MTPTTDDLKREYHAAHLWRAGVTLQAALRNPLVRFGLELAAKAHAKPQQPQQLKLI